MADVEEIERMLKDCLKRKDKLSEGDLKFVTQMREQFKERRLAIKQAELLEKIWNRVTS